MSEQPETTTPHAIYNMKSGIKTSPKKEITRLTKLTWEEMLLRRLLEAESRGSSLEMTSSSCPISSWWEVGLSWVLRCSTRSVGTNFLV